MLFNSPHSFIILFMLFLSFGLHENTIKSSLNYYNPLQVKSLNSKLSHFRLFQNSHRIHFKLCFITLNAALFLVLLQTFIENVMIMTDLTPEKFLSQYKSTSNATTAMIHHKFKNLCRAFEFM